MCFVSLLSVSVSIGTYSAYQDHTLLKFPNQCILTTEAIMWSKDMSEALQNGSLRGLSDLKYVFLDVYVLGSLPIPARFFLLHPLTNLNVLMRTRYMRCVHVLSIRVLCHLLFLNSLTHGQQFVRVSVISQWICTQP